MATSKRLIDLTGRSFGAWIVLGRAGSDDRGQALWLCRCACGTVRTFLRLRLIRRTWQRCRCRDERRIRPDRA